MRHEALVQQHFRCTLRYWEQVYADRTVYARIYQERANSWPLQQILDPVFNPALKPIKGCIGKIRRFSGLRARQPRVHAYSLREFDNELYNAGFEKIASQTLGFGPFTLCNQRLLNEEAGWQLHLSLQRLADNGVFLLRSAGLVYLVLTRNSRSPSRLMST